MNNKIPFYHRLVSMAMEHIFTGLLIFPLLFVAQIINMIFLDQKNTVVYFIFYLAMFLYYNKDIAFGKSVTKRMLGYQLLDNRTRKPANNLQCFIRNITGPIWPLEVIVSIVSPYRRIGDFIAGTKLEKIEDTSFNEATKSENLRKKKIFRNFFLDFKKIRLSYLHIFILILGIIYFYGLHYLMFKVLFQI